MPLNRASTVDDFPDPVLQPGNQISSGLQLKTRGLPAANANLDSAWYFEGEVFEREGKVLATSRACQITHERQAQHIPIFHGEFREG
jgi:hypothetical protein